MRYFTEEHELFRSSLRQFLEREVRPNINLWEKQKKIPRYIWEKMGEMGFLGLSYPEEYGGANLDFFYEVIFNEEIGRMNSGGFAVTQQSVQYIYFLLLLYELQLGLEYQAYKLVFRFFCTLYNFF